jgi:hypothetical protein
MRRFAEMTGNVPEERWGPAIRRAARWIGRKRTPKNGNSPHSGLLPSGFSAEHLGPSDHYYWDDFWSVEGLRAGAYLLELLGDKKSGADLKREADDLLHCAEKSLQKAAERLGSKAMPASPYRRLDSGAIGSLAAGYPLKLWSPDDGRLKETAEYLMKNCFVNGGFFHDMSHSGINPYLTLHIAQVLLRRGDERFFDLVRSTAGLASSAGSWPEAVHPRTGGGCMGDGRHVWAAAEWILMLKACFVREEGDSLVLCSGIPREWCEKAGDMRFGPAKTAFGDITVSIKVKEGALDISWDASWRTGEPRIDIRLPGREAVTASRGAGSVIVKISR